MNNFKKRFISLTLVLTMVLSNTGALLPSIVQAIETEEAVVSTSETTESQAVLATAETEDLVILHTNDLHGNVEGDDASKIGYAKYKTIIDEYEAKYKNVLVLDAGDATHGTNLASVSNGEAVVELMNMLGVDGFTPGNHDFNYGFDGLKSLESKADFPVLASNVVDTETQEKVFEDGVIIPMDGFEVGLFGLATEETKVKSSPKNTEGLDFVDEVNAANEVVDELEAKGADVIILLSHLGMDEESEVKSTDIAAQVEGIDVIIDGHSHTVLPNGQKSGNSFIASAGEHLKNIGVTTVDMENNDDVAGVSSKLITYDEMKDVEKDPEVQAKIDEVNNDMKEQLDVVIGKTTTDLDGVREHVRTGETNLGNLITDAIKNETGADVVLTNGGGIRESISAGDVTLGDVLLVLPFGNQVTAIEVTGQDIVDALTFGVSDYPNSAGKFPHVSGMTFEIVTKGSGNTIRNVMIDNKPIDLKKTYTLATNDFMAIGGDGYTMFEGKEQVSLYGLMADIVADYITALTQENGAVDYKVEGRVTSAENLKYIGDYSTGYTNADGGVAEIVQYNADNDKMYLVNGAAQSVDIVSIDDLSKVEKRLDIKAMGKEKGFTAGDITSVSVNTARDIIAIAVQDEAFDKSGNIVILDYDGNYITKYAAGVQPDMVTFSPDGNYVMSADEGEPREGYGEGVVDPKGTVTVVDLSAGVNKGTTEIVDFTSFDSQREKLITDKVLLKPDTAPSVDLEPEYIAVAEDGKTAYVSLQEANAIATLDIASKTFTSIKGLGFKDYSQEGNALDVINNGTAELSTEDLYGVYMPDGIDVVTINGKQYVLTANEGDAREWGDEDSENFFIDEDEVKLYEDGKKVRLIKPETKEGLDENNNYLYGGRSFSIRDAETMELVFDSGNDFEKMTAELYPEHFNASNDDNDLDSRSNKKGPEPESVTTVEVGDKVYAFIALERIGGVMMYDITDPANATFVDYVNQRDFTGTEDDLTTMGSLGPEGLYAIPGVDSPSGKPMLLVANEVSGNVDVYEMDAPAVEKPITSRFTDVPLDDWAYGYINNLEMKNIIKGYDDGTFKPNSQTTRAQAVKMIVIAAGLDYEGMVSDFADVTKDHWATEYVAAAAEAGIIKGYGDQFKPNEKVTRAQVAKMVTEAFELKTGQKDVSFKDVPNSHWANEYVEVLASNEIVKGYDNGNFEPNKQASRAQFAKMVSLAMEK